MTPHPVDSNLWALQRDFVRFPGATVHDDADLLWYTEPGTNSWLNGASRCPLGRKADKRMAQVVSAVDALGMPAMWHQTPSSQPEHLGRHLAARGFEPTPEPGMAMTIDGPLEMPPTGLVISTANTRTGVLEWVLSISHSAPKRAASTTRG